MARSFLFVPGDRPERFDKALAAGADRVIVDLEDAVAAADKHSARSAVAAWLDADKPVALRINGVDTEWFGDDLALCGAAGVVAVVVPKAESQAVLSRVALAAPRAMLLPLIETAAGFEARDEIARTPGVDRLLFGTIDFQLDLGISGDGDELLMFRSALVLCSRLAGIAAPVDGVCTAIDDAGRLRTDALRARALGFGAKLCIHPRQVAVVNTAFMPSEPELAWARRVLAAAEASGGAAVSLDGAMIDRPVILRAQGILAAST